MNRVSKKLVALLLGVCFLLLYSCYLGDSAQDSKKPYLNSPVNAPSDLRFTNESITDNSAVLVWEKPEDYKYISSYNIYKDGELLANTRYTYYKATNLTANSDYTFTVRAVREDKKESADSNSTALRTTNLSKRFNVKDYGAVGDGKTMDTKAIQRTIDKCSAGGTVYFPAGTYLSGALFLKSDMIFYVSEGAQIKCSVDINEYPAIFTRHEGVERKAHASLINIGVLDNKSGPTTSNVKIMGAGTIGDDDNGKALRIVQEEKNLYPASELVTFKNCENVYLDGIKANNGAFWTMHLIYSNNVTAYGVFAETTVKNGDGISSDSTTNMYVLNCRFSTGDDCVTLKSGMNQEGRDIGRPAKNVYVRGCTMIRGHGSIVIGSDMSGGVSDLYVEDCEMYVYPGVRIKANPDRGSYVSDIFIRDSKVNGIAAYMDYTSDTGSHFPVYKDMKFTNLIGINSKGETSDQVISMNGIKNSEGNGYIENIEFDNCLFSKASLSHCNNILFKDCILEEGIEQANCSGVVERKALDR